MQRGEYLIAINADTGAHVASFGKRGRVNLSAALERGMTHNWSGAPLVVGDVVVGHTTNDTFDSMTAARGDVRAYDVRSGAPRWAFHVIPQARELGVDTWENGSWECTGHGSVWSLFSADPELGLLYMPTSSPRRHVRRPPAR